MTTVGVEGATTVGVEGATTVGVVGVTTVGWRVVTCASEGNQPRFGPHNCADSSKLFLSFSVFFSGVMYFN